MAGFGKKWLYTDDVCGGVRVYSHELLDVCLPIFLSFWGVYVGRLVSWAYGDILRDTLSVTH
jgi:hypothetical protein